MSAKEYVDKALGGTDATVLDFSPMFFQYCSTSMLDRLVEYMRDPHCAYQKQRLEKVQCLKFTRTSLFAEDINKIVFMVQLLPQCHRVMLDKLGLLDHIYPEDMCALVRIPHLTHIVLSGSVIVGGWGCAFFRSLGEAALSKLIFLDCLEQLYSVQVWHYLVPKKELRALVVRVHTTFFDKYKYACECNVPEIVLMRTLAPSPYHM